MIFSMKQGFLYVCICEAKFKQIKLVSFFSGTPNICNDEA